MITNEAYSEFDISVNGKAIGAAVMLINALYKCVKNITIGENTILVTTKDNRTYSYWQTELIKDLANALRAAGEVI